MTTTLNPDLRCLLCDSSQIEHLGRQKLHDIDFYRCGNCKLIFKSLQKFPTSNEERAQYLLHENDPSDPRYRRYLRRLLDPLAHKLTPGMVGLDYGCGPSRTAEMIFFERGWKCSSYDPFFFPEEKLLQRSFDFIFCAEVIEHFHSPATEFARLNRLLNPGGWLGIMTQTPPESGILDWWYQRDPTHVVFYSASTLQWIARNWEWQYVPKDPDENGVSLLRKN